MADCRLYLISPERIDHPSVFAAELRAALDGGDVAAFLLWLIDTDDTAIARVADTLRPVCQQRDVAFLIAERPDLAAKLDCDGVHIGEDIPYPDARRDVGPQRQIGVACGASRHLAMEAAEAGADYVAFDATPEGLETLAWWSSLMEVPCVAMGDALETCKPIVAAGADFLAIGEGVWQHKDGPEAAVRAFNALLSANG